MLPKCWELSRGQRPYLIRGGLQPDSHSFHVESLQKVRMKRKKRRSSACRPMPNSQGLWPLLSEIDIHDKPSLGALGKETRLECPAENAHQWPFNDCGRPPPPPTWRSRVSTRPIYTGFWILGYFDGRWLLLSRLEAEDWAQLVHPCGSDGLAVGGWWDLIGFVRSGVQTVRITSLSIVIVLLHWMHSHRKELPGHFNKQKH